jgi:ribosomal-protein-alanine N-acetyltransferase
LEQAKKRGVFVEIKRVEESDYEEIISLIKKEFPYVSFDQEKIRKRIESNSIFLFKAVEGKEMQGFTEIELLEGNLARINGLTVKEEFRNRGIAKKILDFALDFLREKKVGRILLLVKQRNEAAKKLYKEAGFEFIGMYHRELDNEEIEEMELDIAPEGGLSYVG